MRNIACPTKEAAGSVAIRYPESTSRPFGRQYRVQEGTGVFDNKRAGDHSAREDVHVPPRKGLTLGSSRRG
ncbi:hypothetical protein DICSQDRAFT_137169 [Dichomitus squalens LYAD-421 SS1]|uniref:Uncharacterized protein n=1 Tax=Dichomitus squalens (strain LYAD-421) TaxID=732165 RepID=R7T165_DICSQ|nr:uncharacterized protein DICSQDRAFT_137169 [Dichomitus squalens LYAD-421 SS1]EJF60927.1 hypothetical protein DICSQDRAFT_137169 [Dichomitus squalens LYAD-421 SS1]